MKKKDFIGKINIDNRGGLIIIFRDPWLDSIDNDEENVLYKKSTNKTDEVEESLDAFQAKTEIESFKKFSEKDIQEMCKEVYNMLNPSIKFHWII